MSTSQRQPRQPDWQLPVECAFMPYETFCEMRQQEPRTEFLGYMVRISDGEAHLCGPATGESP